MGGGGGFTRQIGEREGFAVHVQTPLELLATQSGHDGPDRFTPIFPQSFIHAAVITVPHVLAHNPDQTQLCVGLQTQLHIHWFVHAAIIVVPQMLAYYQDQTQLCIGLQTQSHIHWFVHAAVILVPQMLAHYQDQTQLCNGLQTQSHIHCAAGVGPPSRSNSALHWLANIQSLICTCCSK